MVDIHPAITGPCHFIPIVSEPYNCVTTDQR
jgi:hypothetical protein